MSTPFLNITTVDELAFFFGYSDRPSFEHAVFGFGRRYRYREFALPKKSGGLRLIQAPNGELKRMQRRLADALHGIYRPPKAVHGFVAARSILTNADQHLSRDYVFNVDLEDFFPSIHMGRVQGLFRAAPFGFDSAVARMLAQICCFGGSLPQGAPTSPVVSNMICRALDRKLTLLATANRCTYTRYVDDISFSFATARHAIPTGIVEIVHGDASPGADLLRAIESEKFRINSSKVRLAGQSSRMEVTGITVNVRRNVRRRTVRQLDAMLHAWETHSLEAAQQEFDEKYDKSGAHSRRPKDFRQVVAGKLSFLLSVRGINDSIYIRRATKFNELIGDDMAHMPVPPETPKDTPSLVSGPTGPDAVREIHLPGTESTLEYDAFISHATEDKVAFVKPLADALDAGGARIWYDAFELRVGDSLRRSINRGLARSRFGIVVLSPSFFKKEWTQYELDGLTAQEIDRGGKVILPIWHGVTKSDVLAVSPPLADKVALSTDHKSLEEITQELLDVLRSAG